MPPYEFVTCPLCRAQQRRRYAVIRAALYRRYLVVLLVGFVLGALAMLLVLAGLTPLLP